MGGSCEFCRHRTCGEYALYEKCFRCSNYIMICSENDVNDDRYVCDCINYENRNILIICNECQKLSDIHEWYNTNALPKIKQEKKLIDEKNIENAISVISRITNIKYCGIEDFIKNHQMHQ